jgi:hypothetical protein
VDDLPLAELLHRSPCPPGSRQNWRSSFPGAGHRGADPTSAWRILPGSGQTLTRSKMPTIVAALRTHARTRRTKRPPT